MALVFGLQSATKQFWALTCQDLCMRVFNSECSQKGLAVVTDGAANKGMLDSFTP